MTATATSGAANPFRLTVLNPGGRDPALDFSAGAGAPGDRAHPPVNFHGYAACTGGVFHRETKAAIAAGLPVLLLLRGDFRETRAALPALRAAGLTTAVSFKETGLHQIAQQLSDPKRAALFQEIVAQADGFLAATPEAAEFGGGPFIPTPYPLAEEAWDFSRPLAERRGIFLGTREWDVPSRNHLAAFTLAAQLGAPVTAFEDNPKRAHRLWNSLGGKEEHLRLLTRRLPYRAYLEEVAGHKIILQADRSAVPGQVAGDALLCRMPCVGGDGAIDRLGFARTCGFGRSLGALKELAQRLLEEEKFYAEIVAESQQAARSRLSFEVVAGELERFFQALARASK